jgi:hypothetical protein
MTSDQGLVRVRVGFPKIRENLDRTVQLPGFEEGVPELELRCGSDRRGRVA